MPIIIKQHKSITNIVFQNMRDFVIAIILLFIFIQLRLNTIGAILNKNSYYKIIIVILGLFLYKLLRFYIFKIEYYPNSRRLIVYSHFQIPFLKKIKSYKVKEIRWVDKYERFIKHRVLELITQDGKRIHLWPDKYALLNTKELDEFVKQVQKSLDEHNMR